MRISDWSSDVCSSDLPRHCRHGLDRARRVGNDEKSGFLQLTDVPFGAEHGQHEQPVRELAPYRQQRLQYLFAEIIGVGQGGEEADDAVVAPFFARSEEHTSELQSLMRISYAVFCLKKK